jgi:saccharopine dehydrogenase-like NADP-dependent oxidoreductase
MTRVVLLGAGGAMGREAARYLANSKHIDELVLSDLVEASAHSTMNEIGEVGQLVSVEKCDVLDSVAIRQLLESADLVVNCAGPFFRLGLPTLEAAIDSRTTYLDICDDPEPTIEMLALDEKARMAGVCAVVGMGASPGLSNLLARRAASELDVIIDCFTAWSLDSSTTTAADNSELVDESGEPSGAVIHFMEQIHGVVSVVEDGILVRRPPLEAVELTYPGVSDGTGYVVGHPEPVTLHKSLAIKGRSANLVLVKDGGTAAFLKGLQRDLDSGSIDLIEAGRQLVAPSLTRTAKAALGSLQLDGSGQLPPLFALVTGLKDGKNATVSCHVTSLPHGMSGATAVPAVIGVDQLLVGALPPGVHPPEQIFNPERVLTMLIHYCPTEVVNVDALAPVVAVWH